jgi:hypothetical protein
MCNAIGIDFLATVAHAMRVVGERPPTR